ncbi:MAG: S8 family serine peptidase [Coriobacteriales bacterium]|nr:S8 family serine peptidase [Coriobacteriales bacterium]
MISPKVAASYCKNGIALVVSLALVLALVPFALAEAEDAWGVDASAAGESVEGAAAEREALLDAGAYAEGEVIAIVDTSVQRGGMQTLAADLLDTADTLMRTTEHTYREATEGVSEAEPEPLQHSAASLAVRGATETVAIKHIVSEELSCEELLELLWDDPRVLAVEPNYTYELSPVESSGGASPSLYESYAAAARRILLPPDAEAAASDGSSPDALLSPSSERAALSPAALLSPADTKPMTDYQWGMDNTDAALMSSTKELDFDINPPDWNTPGEANASGTIAVVDTGIDYTHPDLAGVMRSDMNDFVDYGGAYGYNALEDEDPTDPMDDHMHGTHCAGIIASEWNAFGTSGVASGVRLVAVKMMGAGGKGSSASYLKGYEYLADAVESGLDLKVISNSWGSSSISRSFLLAVTKLGELGAITVKASGNDGTDVDVHPYDSGILQGNPYVVVVGSSAMNGALSDFSNYGRATTNLIAPGTTILSTVPTTMSNYLPEAVRSSSAEKNLVYESFTGSASVFKTYDENDGEIGERATEIYYDNNDGATASHGSWQVDIKDTEGLYETRDFKAKLFLSQEDLDASRYLSLSFLPRTEAATCTVMLFLNVKTQTGEDELPSAVATIRRNEWDHVLFDFASLRSQGLEPATVDGSLTLAVLLLGAGSKQPLTDADSLYIDAVGLGVDGAAIPYAYESGTSMATPAAAGAAMIVSEGEDPAMPPSEQALLRAATLAACVRPIEGFDEFCTSGGELDLAAAAAGSFTPVINSAEVKQVPAGNLVTLHGYYFGSAAGTVTIGGLPAPVEAWESTAITMLCPTGLASGVHEVRVTTGTGTDARTGQKSVLLNLAAPPAEQSTPLFEKDYALPFAAGFPEAVSKLAMAGLGGLLYVLPNDDDALAAGCTTMLWQLNPATGAWVRCADLPLILDSPSVTTFEGKLAVSALVFVEDAEVNQQMLLLYDPLTDSWEARALPISYLAPVLANCNGSLLLLGGREYDEAGNFTLLDQVSVYDTAADTVTPFASLKTPGDVTTLSVAVHENALFVTERDGTAAELIAWPTGEVTDMSATLPALDSARTNSVVATPVAAGIVLSGASALASASSNTSGTLSLAEDTLVLPLVEDALAAPLAEAAPAPLEDHDTYLLDVADLNSSGSFAPFAKRTSYSQLYNVDGTTHRGALYTAGSSYFESGNWIVRATAVPTLNQPGDLPIPPGPRPAPVTPVLPQTGDSVATTTLLALLAMLTLGGVATLCVSLTLRRRRGQKTQKG